MIAWMLLVACRAPGEAPPIASHEVVVAERGGVSLDSPLPTVVALHGLGDAPERFVHSLDGLDGPVRVVAVGAPLAWGDDGHAWWTRRVADGEWDALATDVAAASDALQPLLAALAEREDVCGKPVVTGFSQGGMLAYALAGRHSADVAAAVPVAGTVLQGVATGPWAPTHALHGTADTVVPYDRTVEAVRALTQDGEPVTLESFDGVAHRIPAPVRAAWYAALSNALPSCPEASP